MITNRWPSLHPLTADDALRFFKRLVDRTYASFLTDAEVRFGIGEDEGRIRLLFQHPAHLRLFRRGRQHEVLQTVLNAVLDPRPLLETGLVGEAHHEVDDEPRLPVLVVPDEEFVSPF